MSCPTIGQLLAFAHDEVSADEAEEVRSHVYTGCARCNRRFSQLQRVLAVMGTPKLKEPPHWLLRQGRALFERTKSLSRQGALKNILALLVVDNFADGPLLGSRHVGPASRQMLYRTDEYDIDLSIDSIEPSQSVEIIGQSIPLSDDFESVADAEVELWQGRRAVVATKMNELGEFTFDQVPAGIYDLKIRMRGEEIHIAGLEAMIYSTGGHVIH